MIPDEVDSLETLPAQLAGFDLFSNMDPATLRETARRAALIDFPRGSLITRQGDAAEGFFVISRGSAEVVVETADGGEQPVDILSHGDCVGDLAILLDQPRTATVRAIRDCQALQLSNADFEWLLGVSPAFAQKLARTMADRLQRTTRGRARTRAVSEVVAVTLTTGDGPTRFAADLGAQIDALTGGTTSVRAVSATTAHNWPTAFAEADAILLLADAEGRPDTQAVRRLLDEACDIRPRPAVAIILLHDHDPPYRGAIGWLRDRRLTSWHHARIGIAADAARVARRVTGRSVGLVLSGGGARGFAHLGVLRAFEDAGIPIDFIAGTSMGGILAAQYASGIGIDAMLAHMQRTYVKPTGLPDFTFPSVAMYSGRGTERRLKAIFGDARIEDLPVPGFVVSADLRTAETIVHETGGLLMAARATCAVPGMTPPIPWRGRLLVDGGLLDNLPVETMRKRFPGRIVASDVSVAVEFDDPPPPRRGRWRFWRPRNLPGIGQIMMRTAQLATVRDSRESGIPADLYLNPGINDVGMSDFSRIDEIVERGAAHARKQLEGWTI